MVPKIMNFVEDVVPLYSLRGHFRLSKEQVEVMSLLTTLGPVYMNLQQTKLPLINSVLACLWTLANQESYRGVADRFNMSKSTLAKHLHEFCCYVNTYMAHHISWPRGQRLAMSKLGFDAAGFPNTDVQPHCDNPLAYLNRKQFYSVNLTGFCDSQRRFCHISRLVVLAPHSLVQLMRPYRDNGHLSARQKQFNRKLNTARVVIEHAFGILKCKFRRLQCLQMRSISNISSAVSACCILHNICLEASDDVVVLDDGVDDEPHPQQPHNTHACHYRDQVCGQI
ncbi:hypothetical protein ABG768_018881 [Culter alburnus]|uniref:DDE Tnp4 domain-containing protein n=1 Tax=Culter alburnus TaxID=194366 RepID=A0AAW2ATI9_CULAL